MIESISKDKVVIYHANCADGFGAAYAAWKKFGDEADYIPTKTQEEPPEGLENKEVYILDYSYDEDTIKQLNQDNKFLIVIDHHISAKDAVESLPQNIFDNNHSGAVLAWQYFHSDKEVPEPLLYIEDHDLWKMSLPKHREYNIALKQDQWTFESFDKMVENLKSEDYRKEFVEKGALLAEFDDSIVENIFQYREKINFIDKEIYAINASRVYRSILGNKLAILNEKEGREAMGLVYYHYAGAVHVSMRSKGDVDVSVIAQKYGGGGHKNAASFRVGSFSDLPFTFV